MKFVSLAQTANIKKGPNQEAPKALLRRVTGLQGLHNVKEIDDFLWMERSGLMKSG